jgi:hypothetical protein
MPDIHGGIHISGSKYGMFVFATHAVRTHQKTEYLFVFFVFVIGQVVVTPTTFLTGITFIDSNGVILFMN